MKTNKSIFLALLFLLLFIGTSFAAGTCTSVNKTFGDLRVTTMTCTADAANGSFTANQQTPNIDGFVKGIIVVPQTTNPTADWDWTFFTNGTDAFGGKGTNMSASATFRSLPYDATATAYVENYPVTGKGSLTITGNSVNSAGIVFIVFSSLKL